MEGYVIHHLEFAKKKPEIVAEEFNALRTHCLSNNCTSSKELHEWMKTTENHRANDKKVCSTPC
jgi:hypothetical protein